MISYFLAPIVGGAIGYITNALAIKMLFRPHRAIYIFGMRVPLTPGIIPKRKGQIADSIGNVVAANLMNHEVLQKYLLSDDMVGRVRTSVNEFVEKQKNNDETVKQFLCYYLSEEEIEALAVSVNDSITSQTYTKLVNPEMSDHIAEMVLDHVENSDLTQQVSLLGGLLKTVSGSIVKAFHEPLKRLLTKNINEVFANNGKEFVSNMIGGEVHAFLNNKVSAVLEGKDEQLEKMVNNIESFYKTIITEHLSRILESVNISKLVSDRVNEMDMCETERLILQIVNKELKALVWFGAMLGLLIGCINIFV